MFEENNIKKIEFDLLENGLDFILSSLDPILEPKNNFQLKYSILHLSAGIELILKERLRVEHWTLIFENTNNACILDLSSGNFQTINLETALIRLENICGIIIPDKDKQILRELRKRRNRIEHFAFKEIDVAIKSLVSKVLSTIFSFITDTLDQNTHSKVSIDQISVLRKKVKNFSEFTKLRMTQLKEDIEMKAKVNDIINCPMCYQSAFLLSNDLKCLFCGYCDTPENVAEIYIENILGVNRYINTKYGGDFQLEECPECSEISLIDNGTNSICFNCQSKFSNSNLNECSNCGKLYPYDEDGLEICDDCLKFKIEKW